MQKILIRYRFGDLCDHAIFFFFFPAGLCPDWESWDPSKPVDNAREAMQQADDWLGVPQVIFRYFVPLF